MLFTSRIKAAIRRPIALVFLLVLRAYCHVSGRRYFIICGKHGQLCNRLWLAAHIIASGIQNKFEVINVAFSDYAACFPSTAGDILCRYPKRRLTFGMLTERLGNILFSLIDISSSYRRERPDSSTTHTYDLGSPESELDIGAPSFRTQLSGLRVVFFRGWLFRDRESLLKHGGEVRSYFSPPDWCRDAVHTAVAQLRKSADVVIGIHIRHGDYRTHCDGIYFFDTAVYVRKMHEVACLFPGKAIAYFVCSNERQSLEAFGPLNFAFRPFRNAVMPFGSVLCDLYALAECDFILGAPSSFSCWASFYGRVPLYSMNDATAVPALSDFVVCDY